MEPDKYMQETTPKFKEKSRRYYTKSRNLALTILIIPLLYVLTVYFSPLNNYITPIALIILFAYVLGFIFLLSKIVKEKPSFKEYVLYYFWQGKYYLNKYSQEGASEQDIKSSLKFFKKLQTVLFQNYDSFGPYRFETEENMEKSIGWLEKWTKELVIYSLKKRQTEKLIQTVNEVFNGTYRYFVDEDFSGLTTFLKPYTALYIVKSENKILNFFDWLNSSYKRCIIFYGILCVIIIIVVCYAIYFYYGLVFLFGIFTISSVIISLLAILHSYLKKKFLIKQKN